MEGIGFGINKMGGMEGPFGGGMENMGRFGSGMNMGRINGGGGGSVPGIERMGPGIDRIGGAGMERMGAGLGHGMDRVGSEIERMGLVMDRMGSVERMGSGIERMGPLGLDHMASSIERMGQTMERIGSGVERMGAGMGFGLERMAAPIDRVGQTIERMGSGVERMGPAIERMGLSMERMVPAGMGSGVGDGSVRGRGRTPTGAQASTDFLSHSPLQATLASLPLLKQATHIPTPGLSHSSWNVLSPEAHKYPPSSLKSLLPSCPGHTSVSLPVFNHLPALAWTCPPWHGVLNSVHHYLLGGGCWFTVYVPQPDCRLLKHTLSCSLLHHQHQVRSA